MGVMAAVTMVAVTGAERDEVLNLMPFPNPKPNLLPLPMLKLTLPLLLKLTLTMVIMVMATGTLMEVMATDIGTEKEVLMLNQALMPMLTMVTMVTDMAITWVSEALMPKLTPNLTMVTGPVMVTDILIIYGYGHYLGKRSADADAESDAHGYY